jgi:hypothetical protein
MGRPVVGEGEALDGTGLFLLADKNAAALDSERMEFC